MTRPDTNSGNRIKCPRCGAMKEQTAFVKCQPIRGHDDEYECPMDYVTTDKDGWFVSTILPRIDEITIADEAI
jgi:hypothetical protein